VLQLEDAHWHEASERTAIPLQSNLIAATAFIEPQKEWYYIGKDGVQVGPLEKDAVRRAWSKEELGWNTKCWASGMTDWKRMRDIRELRWAFANKVGVLTPVQVWDYPLPKHGYILMIWMQSWHGCSASFSQKG
jgi:DnaJ family protein C protein 13